MEHVKRPATATSVAFVANDTAAGIPCVDLDVTVGAGDAWICTRTLRARPGSREQRATADDRSRRE